MNDQNAGYETIFHALRTEPETEALNHLMHLRAASDIESFAESLKLNQAAKAKRPRSSLQSTSLDGVDGVDGVDGMDGEPSGSHESSYDHETDFTDHSPDPQLVTVGAQPAFLQTMRRPTPTTCQLYAVDGDSHSQEPDAGHTSFAPHLAPNL